MFCTYDLNFKSYGFTALESIARADEGAAPRDRADDDGSTVPQ